MFKCEVLCKKGLAGFADFVLPCKSDFDFDFKLKRTVLPFCTVLFRAVQANQMF